MATVLIPTIHRDIHAAAVAIVLEQMGHQPLRWFCGDLPEAATASFAIGSGAEGLAIREASGLPVDVAAVDVLWNRRVGDPVVRSPAALPCDRQVAFDEMKSFLRGMLATISDRAF